MYRKQKCHKSSLLYCVLGFVSPMQYLKMKKLSVKQFELMPVSPVFVHPKNTAEKPGYYSDIIMHVDAELEQIIHHIIYNKTIFLSCSLIGLLLTRFFLSFSVFDFPTEKPSSRSWI